MVRSNFLTNRFDLLVRFASRQNEHKKQKKLIGPTPLKSPQGDTPK